MDDNQIETQLHSATWFIDETQRVMGLMKECKTEHEKQKYILQLQQLNDKLKFEGRQLDKMFGTKEEMKRILEELTKGENWKNEEENQ